MHKKIVKYQKIYLIVCTLIVGLCSIIYELLISTTASYFLGNSIKQFSLVIGIYMASMGVGSFISRYILKNSLFYFTIIELFLGLVGAFSVPFCYFYFLHSDFKRFNFITFVIIGLIGMLTGLEVPLLTRVMEARESLKNNISTVLTFDYIGALFATLLFPFFLVPFVGLYQSSLIFGLINVIIGLLTYFVYKPSFSIKQRRLTLSLGVLFSLLILGALFYSKKAVKKWNENIFFQEVVYQKETPYQNIILTATENDVRLYLNGAIQFSSKDEYRYHEALVHIPLNQLKQVKNVLLLGGGEGFAAREILKYDELESLEIIDIDPEISKLSKDMDLVAKLNDYALSNSKVKVYHQDAFTFLMNTEKQYDAIICDLPDPTSEALARLYSNAFYRLVKKAMQPNGVMVTQATSPELTKNAFWCIDKTIQSVGFSNTFPYQTSVPSFGVWGFVMAKNSPEVNDSFRSTIKLNYLENGMMNYLSYFPKDKRAMSILPNNLDQPVLLEYYIDHWHNLQGRKR